MMTSQPAADVVVGLSGGVDSSVAAYLLLEAGCSVQPVFMRNWEEDDLGTCAADLEMAERACATLGLALRTVNFAYEYWERVFEAFLAGHRAGRTPNPDILCNREIKFRELLAYAESLGARRLATGHYARIGRNGNELRLLKGADPGKDQSYFLYTLGRRELSSCLFPVGGLTKTEVRDIARRVGLPNHGRRDSTGICFIGERDHRTFLARYLPPQPGEIRTPDERVVGRHEGVMFYTLGQRHGLGIGGPGAPWYVAGKAVGRNVLYVVQGHDHPLLFRREADVTSLHWVAGAAPGDEFRCRAKSRYRQAEQPCDVTLTGSGEARVRFDRPQRALTPGQSIVFYAEQTCLGGGIIEVTSDGDEVSRAVNETERSAPAIPVSV